MATAVPSSEIANVFQGYVIADQVQLGNVGAERIFTSDEHYLDISQLTGTWSLVLQNSAAATGAGSIFTAVDNGSGVTTAGWTAASSLATLKRVIVSHPGEVLRRFSVSNTTTPLTLASWILDPRATDIAGTTNVPIIVRYETKYGNGNALAALADDVTVSLREDSVALSTPVTKTYAAAANSATFVSDVIATGGTTTATGNLLYQLTVTGTSATNNNDRMHLRSITVTFG